MDSKLYVALRNVAIGLWSLVIVIFAISLPTIVKDNQSQQQNLPPALPTAIAETGTPFEHCVIKDNTGIAFREDSGTPIPPAPMPMNTPIPEQVVATPQPIENGPIQPTPTMASQQSLKLEIVNIGGFNKDNYHIVFVGVGYGNVDNETVLVNTIDQIKPNFKNIRIDFAYVIEPVSVSLTHIAQTALFSNTADRDALFSKIKLIYPVDTIFFVVNTNEGLGYTEGYLRGPGYSYVSGNDGNINIIVTHEIGHHFGLNDGYNEYIPSQIPGSELFYADSLPPSLIKALKELGTIPPMYAAGTCNGKQLYTFYDTSNNIYGNYSPKGPNSWGESMFTPLQIIEMNDFVTSLRGGIKTKK